RMGARRMRPACSKRTRVLWTVLRCLIRMTCPRSGSVEALRQVTSPARRRGVRRQPLLPLDFPLNYQDCVIFQGVGLVVVRPVSREKLAPRIVWPLTPAPNAVKEAPQLWKSEE